MPFIDILNNVVHYESIRVEYPANDQIVLIFLHEALGSIPQWKSFTHECCKSLRLNGIVYERQGHGKSGPLKVPRNERYLHDCAFEELPAVIETLLPASKKVILVGHSDGGTIALLYASKFQRIVSATITIAAHVINEPETISGIYPAIEAFERGKLDKLKTFHGDNTSELFYAWANTWCSKEFSSWNICDDLGSLTSPLLSIQGAKDQYGTEKQLSLIQHSVSGLCKTVLLPERGHHPHLENPYEIIEIIDSFLSALNNQYE